MSRGGWARVLPLAAILLISVTVLAAPSGPVDPALQAPGQARVRTDQNCYLPAEIVTFTLKNVGASTLVYGSLPDFEVENGSIGVVRQIDAFVLVQFRLDPGESVSWTWDQKWRAWDGNGDPINKNMLVPRGEYIVRIEVFAGFPIGEPVTIARDGFEIGDCLAQISAGDDVFVEEGTPFRFAPRIEITGDAEVRSVTWDLDPAVDANGDGNFTNDIDLAGHSPEHVYGDDGTYPVTMNVRGFGAISSKDRVDQDVVFAIDSSGSMAWNDPFGMRKLAAKAYVDRMVLEDRGAVVDFDLGADLVGGHHLHMDYAQIKADIDTIDANGGTYLAGGLLTSLRELRDHGDPDNKWLVIFMTDADSVTTRDRFDIPRAIEFAKNLGVPVYTVGLNIPDGELEVTMRQIAQQTGGRFFSTATAANLISIYEDIAEEVGGDQEHGFFTVTDSLTVTVLNAAPTAVLDSTVPLNVTLRVAGEKYHDVSMVLREDGAEVGRVSIVRMPGSPDEQAATFGSVELDLAKTYSATVEYTPLDDPVNGQIQGSDPAWIILGLEGGTELWFHHTFNVEHPDTWVWDVADLEGLFLGGTLVLPAAIADPGSDDITVTWDWGDGTVDVHTYFYDGVGPDPFPSPTVGGVSLLDTGVHTYAVPGSYTVTLTVTDDDGGTTTIAFVVSLAALPPEPQSHVDVVDPLPAYAVLPLPNPLDLEP